MKKLIAISTSPSNGDIILDMFAGSGSTGSAVLRANETDAGNRKFILMQLPEHIEPDSSAYKAGFKKISDVTIERLKRDVAQKQKESGVKLALSSSTAIDLGFKVFKLDRSNFKLWSLSH